jgi:hypothetical protein
MSNLEVIDGSLVGSLEPMVILEGAIVLPDGFDLGFTAGHKEGYTEGYDKGEFDGYTKGETDGRKSGYNEGYGKGYDEGYADAGENSLTAKDLAFTGEINYMFSHNRWNWFIYKFGDLMSFNDITNLNQTFVECNSIEDLSALTFNLKKASMQTAFNSCGKLKKLPKINGTIQPLFDSLFSSCCCLTSEEINNFFSNVSVGATIYAPSLYRVFTSCYSLRDLTATLEILSEFMNCYTGTSSAYKCGSALNACYCLNEITNFPVSRLEIAETSNRFDGTFTNCGRVKNIMFETDNGIPYSVNWKSQTIDLSGNVGYAGSYRYILNYNSGITQDKEVKDETYQSLKNDPDWYTTNAEYSRYNHDSAVNTINSLPDTSAYLATAGGTNTIKFKGAAGSKTDGGAINTLTEEEIAVATAKGWTVTLA